MRGNSASQVWRNSRETSLCREAQRPLSTHSRERSTMRSTAPTFAIEKFEMSRVRWVMARPSAPADIVQPDPLPVREIAIGPPLDSRQRPLHRTEPGVDASIQWIRQAPEHLAARCHRQRPHQLLEVLVVHALGAERGADGVLRAARLEGADFDLFRPGIPI